MPWFLVCALLAAAETTVVVTDIPESDPFHTVVKAALKTAGASRPVRFKDPADALEALRQLRPDSVLVVIRPETLDLNFAYDFLDMAGRVDEDPFVDFVYGFITGRSPEAALAFLKETDAVRRKPGLVPRAAMDCLGPNNLDEDRVWRWKFARMLPKLKGFELASMNHGKRGYPQSRLGDLEGFGYVHFGGHGVPDRIVQGLTADQVSRVNLRHAVVFNGACWTGVTCRSFDWRTGRIRAVETKNPFCLAVLDRGVAAYLAAVHPDHGIPVYQEMERLFSTGETLGEVMKYTYDQVVMASGGKRPAFPRWKDGEAPPALGRGTMELHGTAARVLFGDPRFKPLKKVAKSPYFVKMKRSGRNYLVKAQMLNPDLKYTHMDTFSGDMARNRMQFNDRFYFQADLPGKAKVKSVKVVTAVARKKAVKHRLVSYAVEAWRGRRILHVQVDFPSRGYQVSDIRNPSAKVEVLVEVE